MTRDHLSVFLCRVGKPLGKQMDMIMRMLAYSWGDPRPQHMCVNQHGTVHCICLCDNTVFFRTNFLFLFLSCLSCFWCWVSFSLWCELCVANWMSPVPLFTHQRFPTEDHLMIHRHKHEMTLKFPSIKTDNMLSGKKASGEEGLGHQVSST